MPLLLQLLRSLKQLLLTLPPVWGQDLLLTFGNAAALVAFVVAGAFVFGAAVAEESVCAHAGGTPKPLLLQLLLLLLWARVLLLLLLLFLL